MSDDYVRRFWRCRKTCCEMLEDRGYIVSQHEKNEAFPDFMRRFDEANRQRGQMLLLGSLRTDENQKILVYFSDEPKKTGVRPIKELSDKMEERGISSAILVALNSMTAFARNAIAELAPQRHIEYFMEAELLVNITRHELVPRHIPLSDEEKEELLAQYKIRDIMLPRILPTDPVARYFGLRRGQVVKIIRPSESAGRFVTYRLCT
ncbi:putative DNA-directed RNA polymerase II [Gregarina niphandrodes]|uniref:DNA-directed RNA polymerase II n=1 Tax=Gregarina niphandrodes TaxID=110365 RepID=A0A023B374_GRENI|nr:putative DNA-directed RNA polymerase II [Gregarina niphandrodes]EZG55401.1 putative DNA-directed RNA polymerase II [Gregarina niphandrodes]|eukprot:XP_011131575.1 putative DNA-directed RNA polymerase II [Gregarina niphandrodes]